jgi:tetratricopeptide (TPR) repeat protein
MAKKTSEKAIESELHLNLAYMYQIAGNFGEALNACEKAWDAAVEADHLEWQRSVLHLRGTIQIRMGSIDETRKTCDELKTLIESSMNSKKMRMHHHLVGMIELDRENYSEAIDNFKNAISLLPFQQSTGDRHAMFIDPLALAYYKSRDFEKAQKEYENITQLTVGRLNYGDIYAKSFYMLGKIYEQQGERDKAIEHYEKFLDLWKDADPGIAEVDDARERLAGLTN